MVKPRIIVVGFPKSGTTTLQRALAESGIQARHWMHNGQPIGKLIYDGWFDHDDPFYHFEGIEALTQLDFCKYQPNRFPISLFKKNMPFVVEHYWPNFDFGLLLTIQEKYPECKIVLNYRNPQNISHSMKTWGHVAEIFTAGSFIGLPLSRGATDAERIKWIETQFKAFRHVFGSHPNFLEVDIASPAARSQLEAFFEVELQWWGVENKTNPKLTPRPHPFFAIPKKLVKLFALDQLEAAKPNTKKPGPDNGNEP